MGSITFCWNIDIQLDEQLAMSDSALSDLLNQRQRLKVYNCRCILLISL